MLTDSPDALLGERWVAGWAHARRKSVDRVDGWPFVWVGEESRETELVCVDPGAEAFLSLVRHIEHDPRAMLTVLARDLDPYDSSPLPPGVRVDRDDEILMTAALRSAPVPPISPTFGVRWDLDDHRTTYVVESDDRVAACGTVGVLGDDAVFDAIETTPRFRRRGLGRHVMAVLTSNAVEAGATNGVLAATNEGSRLYRAAGWDQALRMWSLMGSA